jgi:hypothetical protein
MNEVHPSLQRNPLLPPQLLHRKTERFRRSFVVRYPPIPPRIREERLVEILRQVSAILVYHRPHCTNHTPESGVLYRSSQVNSLVHDAPFRHLSRVTSGEKCELGSGQISAHDFEKRKALASVKFKSGFERFSSLEGAVARKVDKPVVLEAIENTSGKRSPASDDKLFIFTEFFGLSELLSPHNNLSPISIIHEK